MTRLADIPIRIEPPARVEPLTHAAPPARNGGLGGGVAAVLSELVGMLEEIVNSGRGATVDLRSLPMSAQDRIELQNALGEGEVQATLNAEGLSTLRETRISGVWWVEHRDRHGDLIAELLEVASVPRILESALDDIATSARELRERIRVGAAAPAGVNHDTRQ